MGVQKQMKPTNEILGHVLLPQSTSWKQCMVAVRVHGHGHGHDSNCHDNSGPDTHIAKWGGVQKPNDIESCSLIIKATVHHCSHDITRQGS